MSNRKSPVKLILGRWCRWPCAAYWGRECFAFENGKRRRSRRRSPPSRRGRGRGRVTHATRKRKRGEPRQGPTEAPKAPPTAEHQRRPAGRRRGGGAGGARRAAGRRGDPRPRDRPPARPTGDAEGGGGRKADPRAGEGAAKAGRPNEREGDQRKPERERGRPTEAGGQAGPADRRDPARQRHRRARPASGRAARPSPPLYGGGAGNTGRRAGRPTEAPQGEGWPRGPTGDAIRRRSPSIPRRATRGRPHGRRAQQGRRHRFKAPEALPAPLGARRQAARPAWRGRGDWSPLGGF